MTYKIVHVEDRQAFKYPGLSLVGGEQQLFDNMVASDFAGWEQFYDVRQSAILKGQPRLFDGADRSPELGFLKKDFGLKPEHRYLDYGCATVASGQHVIKYLNESCYVGMDISEAAIEIGAQRVNLPRLAEKKPNLYHIKNGVFPRLPENSFDIAVALSVFTHCPPEVMMKIIRYVHSLLRKGGVFIASFTDAGDDIVFQGVHNFYYPGKFLIDICDKMKISASIEKDTMWDESRRTARLLGMPKNLVIRKP
ncbi:class I SAM-dependent methyltransferase [Nisaea denitrificans]|uniref:class I SAM-dependent methyltransferase n=1 Tax=Nisaea denitrificans TaxID=390877 RepID=UPI00048AE23F|nr:class I SAM-dependent methyltransferase [Nisaea denitrificans]